MRSAEAIERAERPLVKQIVDVWRRMTTGFPLDSWAS